MQMCKHPPFVFANSGHCPRPDQVCSLIAVLATALRVSSQLILSNHKYGFGQQELFFYIFQE